MTEQELLDKLNIKMRQCGYCNKNFNTIKIQGLYCSYNCGDLAFIKSLKEAAKDYANKTNP